MAVLSKTEISALSTQERLTLIDDLWESMETPLLEPLVEAAHRKIIDERLADYDPTSEELLTLDQISERLLDLEVFPGDDLSLADARSQSLL
jgi:putative addiction module component (TIGR02574 family)